VRQDLYTSPHFLRLATGGILTMTVIFAFRPQIERAHDETGRSCAEKNVGACAETTD